MIDVLEEHADNPVIQEIRVLVAELGDQETADLIALMQPGRGDGTFEDWEALRDQAYRVNAERTGAYLIGEPLFSDYLEEGLSQFGFSCAEFEIGRL